jgi:hypothetical protein
VEQICRRFIDERRSKLSRLIEDKLGWSRLDKLLNDTLVFYDKSHFQAIFIFDFFGVLQFQWILASNGSKCELAHDKGKD